MSSEDLVSDADLKQLRNCHTLQQLEITCERRSYSIPPFAISPKLESLTISCFNLTSDPFAQKKNSLKTLKLCSCGIPDDACDALVRFLQSSHCVLETIEYNGNKHVERIISNKILKGICSSRTLLLLIYIFLYKVLMT